MKKKIPVQDLEMGMHVTELDRPQLDSASLFRGLTIRSQAQIDKLRRYCRYVYIDVPEGSPFPSTSRPASGKWPPSRPFTTKAQEKPEFEILKLGAATHDTGYQPQTTLEEEINSIEVTYEETNVLIKMIMDDVRLGKSIDAAHVRKVVVEMADSVIRNPNALICFAQLQKKQDYTALHSVRVCILGLVLGRHLAFEKEDLTIFGIGALLHDIGKQKIPTELLDKPGRLTEQELELIKGHVPRGMEILKDAKGIPKRAIDIAQYHHERCDGSGYIQALKKEQIPQFGQISAIVDCYGALTSDRAYGTAISAHAALKKIYEWRHTKFDAPLVEQFIQCMGIYPIGSVVQLNTGDVGVVVAINRMRRLKPRLTLVLKADNTAHRPPESINLMHHTTPDGHPFEIERVLEPGALGIKAIDYLPLKVHH